MRNFRFITLLDTRRINQLALRLLLRTMAASNPDALQRLTVLTPLSVDPAALAELVRFNLSVRQYPLSATDDPYYGKFLLAAFIEDCMEDDLICYLDPDHIWLRKPDLSASDHTLYVSSETYPSALDCLPRCTSLPQMGQKAFDPFFYNTSIIFGKAALFKRVVSFWKAVYEDLISFVHYRHREELAFSLACTAANVALAPVAASLQSNFSFFEYNCALFHYGGETSEAQQTKALLTLEEADVLNRPDYESPAAGDAGSWAKSHILRMLQHQKDPP